MEDGRIPPMSREAEQCVLGSMIRDNACIAEVQEILRPQCMYFDAHQKMFECITKMVAGGKPVDLVLLAEDIRVRGWLDDVTPQLIADVYDAAPTSMNAVHYSHIVRDKWLAREIIHVCTESMRSALDQHTSIDDILGEAQRNLLALGAAQTANQTKHISQLLIEFQTQLDERLKNPDRPLGVPTGLIDLDSATSGFHPGQLVILAARPSVGKTALAGNIARNAAKDGHAVLIFSVEQSNEELSARWIATESGVSTHAMQKGRLGNDQVSLIIQAAGVLNPLPIYVNDTATIRTRNMLNIARRLMMNVPLRLIIVDYLGLVTPEDSRVSRTEQVGTVARTLKLMTRDLKIPILCLCQLNRAAEERNEAPKLSHLRDSGEIEQHADTVIFLHRPKEQEDSAPVELIEAKVAKQRQGPCRTIPLMYHKKLMRFENCALDENRIPQ